MPDIVALVAEHSRIEGEWNAHPENDAATARFDLEQRSIEDQVASLIATSAPGIAAQVDLLMFMLLRDLSATDCAERLAASIKASVDV